MANVDFPVAEEATAAFLGAQEDRSVRAVALTIRDEAIVLKQCMAATGDVGADFDGLVAGVGLETSSGTFVLFCTDESASPDGGARKWALVSWVPDLCRPKDKMLYSSSRDNLKRSLGAGYFSGDYYCNEAVDLTWAAYTKAITDKGGDGPLSEVEILKKEEAAMERDTSTRSNAMGEITFGVLAAAAEAMAAFSADPSCAAVALCLEDEKVGVHTPGGCTGGPLSRVLGSPGAPAFVLCRLGARKVITFVYFCPDAAPVKAKMVYSTAKATVLAVAERAGIKVAKVEEVRDVEDLDVLYADADKEAADGGAATLPEAPVLATRVAPPSAGRARTSKPIKKFVADDE